MSRVCSLTGLRRMKINKISIERSRVTKRVPYFSNVNLHKRDFNTDNIGKVEVKIANRTLRTIEKHGGLEKFLLKTKRKNLSEMGKKLRRKLVKTTNHKFK
jgi:large subunit ribosomal protein L28